jgi:hypothetical protein
MNLRRATPFALDLIRFEAIISPGSEDGFATRALRVIGHAVVTLACMFYSDRLLILTARGGQPCTLRPSRPTLSLIHEAEQRGAFVTVSSRKSQPRGEMGHIVLTVLGMWLRGTALQQRAGARG